MRVYKLTDSDMQTKNQTQWGPGVTHEAQGDLVLCSNGIHVYSNPLVAVYMNPIHANYQSPRLFVAEGTGNMLNDGTKLCFQRLKTIREISVPQISTEQRIEVAIRLVLGLKGSSRAYRKWDQNWLNGTDRSAKAANVAAAAARAAADAAAANAANAAYYAAAYYVAAAAHAAAYAATRAAADAAAAAYAAAYAVYAADAAAADDVEAFNRRLIRILRRVCLA
jgi:hypothetical protein